MAKKSKKTGNVRGRLSDGRPNPIDSYVGSRIRLRRCLLGMTQERLAETLGLTFQQIQKYEKGLNRIGASRLWDLSQVLDVPVDFFFDKLDDDAKMKSPRNISAFTLNDSVLDNTEDILQRRDVLKVMRYYAMIPNESVRQNVLNLVRSLSGEDDNLYIGLDDDTTEKVEYTPMPVDR